MSMKKKKMKSDLVFGNGHDGLIFAPEQVAIGGARRIHTLWSSKTWGDLEENLDGDEFRNLCTLYCDSGDEAFEGPNGQARPTPRPEAPFDGPGYFESYPEDAIGDPSELNTCLPKSIRDRYAEAGDGTVCRALTVDAAAEAEIVEELSANGFVVRKDQTLIEASWDPEAARKISIRISQGGGESPA